jgi:hypothetical protein
MHTDHVDIFVWIIVLWYIHSAGELDIQIILWFTPVHNPSYLED